MERERYRKIEDILENQIIIMGAGTLGKRLYYAIKKKHKCHIIFVDNSIEKQNTMFEDARITSLKLASFELKENACFIIPQNGKELGKTAKTFFTQLAECGFDNRTYIVDMLQLDIYRSEDKIRNSIAYLDSLRVDSRRRLDQVSQIVVTTFRAPLLNHTGGGPAKVMEQMEEAIGREHMQIPVSYFYKNDNIIDLSLEYSPNLFLGSVEFGRVQADKNPDSVWISHDVFTAYGLYTKGANYALVYHSQGDIVTELQASGRILRDEEKTYIRYMELKAIQGAKMVAFPSKGAEYFFWLTYYDGKMPENLPQYQKWGPLYNTLVEESLVHNDPIPGIDRREDMYTFLSIGQMTTAKGMDQIPALLEKMQPLLEKQIRWIVVANGPLKYSIANEMKRIHSNNSNIMYVQYDAVNHDQINYLFSISDIYLMLHRISIFDIATLEAMYFDKQVMLSDIQGNREYNVNDNIIMVNNQDIAELCRQIIHMKSINRAIYEKYFSKSTYRIRYGRLIQELVERATEE